MNRTLRIILAVATLLTTLGALGFGVYGLTIPHVGLSVTCFVLAAMFGLFVYHDYQYFFGKKADAGQTKV
jgi:hypothetical protein